MIDARFDQAAWLMAEIQHRRDIWAVHRHPFVERWSAGSLTAQDLQAYAGEHHHVVAAVADVSRAAAMRAEGMLFEQLTQYADEREREVESWCDFAMATGWCESDAWFYAADPLPETIAASRTWIGEPDRTLAHHLVTIYALEMAQAEAARPQLSALLGRYGMRDQRATAYFERHALGDPAAIGLIEAALTGLLPVPDPFSLVRRAELTVRALWDLLDGVQRLSRAAAPPLIS